MEKGTYVTYNETLHQRLSRLPSGVAFGLRSVGSIELDPDDSTPERVLDFVHVVWTVEGAGWACIDDAEYEFPPEHTAAFLPGATHCLRAGEQAWRYRWITLDGPAAVLVVSGLGLDTTPAFSGPCPHALFDELAQAVQAIGADSEKRATVPAYRLLVEAASSRAHRADSAQQSDWVSSIQRLIEENAEDPDVGIRQIAEIAGIDRTTLAYRFRKATGVAPKEYLTALRLQRAMTLLRTSNASVAAVAEQCGFSCANYFIKAFAKRVGTTPHRFRRQAV